MKPPIGRFHVITDTALQDRFSHVELARLAAAGGADAVQFREKRPSTTRALIEIAGAMRRALDGVDVCLVVDDRVDVAMAAGVRAVHLGRDDLDVGTARRVLGPDALIGGTANSLEEALPCAATDVLNSLGRRPGLRNPVRRTPRHLSARRLPGHRPGGGEARDRDRQRYGGSGGRLARGREHTAWR